MGPQRLSTTILITTEVLLKSPRRDATGASPYGVWGAMGTKAGGETVSMP